MGNLENELDNSELHTAGKRQRTTAQFPKETLPDSGESYCSAKEIERIDSWRVLSAMESTSRPGQEGLPLARKRSSSSLRKQSNATNTPSGQKPRKAPFTVRQSTRLC
jgi:hypothetical protein